MKIQNWKIYLLLALCIFLFTYWYYGPEAVKNIEAKKSLNESWTVCQNNFLKVGQAEKIIFMVTPTYSRPEQVAELTRLLQTLVHIQQVLHWIIVEDAHKCSQNVLKLVDRFPDLSYTVISAPTPYVFTVSNPYFNLTLPITHDFFVKLKIDFFFISIFFSKFFHPKRKFSREIAQR